MNDDYTETAGSFRIHIGSHVHQISNPFLIVVVGFALLFVVSVVAFLLIRKLAS